MKDVKVKNLGQLKTAIHVLLENYDKSNHLQQLKKLTEYSITENKFAQIVGRCRLYKYLPSNLKSEIPPILMGENQVSSVVRDYYRDKSFCKDANGNINLWRLYNLLTGANKTSYVDTFLDRSVNAYDFVVQILQGVVGKKNNWYLS